MRLKQDSLKQHIPYFHPPESSPFHAHLLKAGCVFYRQSVDTGYQSWLTSHPMRKRLECT